MTTERQLLHNMFPDLDFDPQELREKYRSERDKRVREDGENQYIEAASEFAEYADTDPYVRRSIAILSLSILLLPSSVLGSVG